MQVATWNVRGLRDRANRATSFAYLKNLKFDIIALQETHAEEDDHANWSREWDGPSAWSGHVGLLLSKKNNISFVDRPQTLLDGRLITVTITSDIIKSPITVYAIYAPVNVTERVLFLELLTDLIQPSQHKIIMGDFNAAPLSALDRWPPPAIGRDEWKDYQTLMDRHELFDLVRYKDTTRQLWTWKRAEGHQRSRIDHLLVSPRLARLCDSPEVHPPPRSDHWPLSAIINFNPSTLKGYKIWRLNTSHLDDLSFVTMVEAHLETVFEILDDPNASIMDKHSGWSKFKALTQGGSILNGRINQKKYNGAFNQNLAQLKALHESPPDITDTVATDQWLQNLTAVEETVTTSVRRRLEARRVRSRSKWVEEGERSTRYFFRCMRARSSTRLLKELRTNTGEVVTDVGEVLTAAADFYTDLFSDPGEPDLDAQEELLGCFDKRITEGMFDILEAEITAEEVADAIKHSPLNSSPGPDGIPFEFYKRFSTDLSIILAELFNISRENNTFLPSWQQTHIVLLPKAGDLMSLANWRPISLSDCDIKLLTRVLAFRLQPIARHCIHESQTGFIKHRSIFDNLHCVHFALQCGLINPQQHAGYLLLLDQQKAYDRVDLFHLDRCLDRVGVGPNFRHWIALMMTNARASIRIGPYLSKSLPISKGLRQGDPLSPLLYNFALEPLMCYLRKNIAGIQLPGFILKTVAFADDVAVAVSNATDVERFNRGIAMHEGASAAKLNANKTVVLTVGQPTFQSPYPTLQPHEPTRYLGIMFTSHGIAEEVMLARLENGINTTVDRWHDRQLSLVGRVMLANACLLSKLWFAAHIIPFPHEFERRIVKKVKQFIWNGKRCKVAEDIITRPKEQGGLGLLPLHEQAIAIFGTWVTKVLDPKEPPKWAPVAHWLLSHHLSTLGLHPSMLCMNDKTQWPTKWKRLPNFWRRLMEFWKVAGGVCQPVDNHWQTADLLALPWSGTTATFTNFNNPTETRAATKRWQQKGANCIGDVFVWSPIHNKMYTFDSPSTRSVIDAYNKAQLALQPTALLVLGNQQSEVTKHYLPFSQLRVLDKEMVWYQPKLCRKFILGTTTLSPKTNRWTSNLDGNAPQRTGSIEMLSWKVVFSPRLEPKHRALLWLMHQGAVATARQLRYMVPGMTANCPICNTEIETLIHYFWECPRIRTYWKMISNFLNNITIVNDHQQPLTTTKSDLLDGMKKKWGKRIPGIEVMHATAVWQIYRAHAEAMLDNTIAPPVILFARWQGEVRSRIQSNLRHAVRNDKVEDFRKIWAKVKCQWFVFEPGEEGERRERVIFNSQPFTPCTTTATRTNHHTT